MTTQQLIDMFRLRADQINAPYFTDGQIIDFLNAAQERVMSRYFENRSNADLERKQGIQAFQLNEVQMNALAKLIYDKAAVTSSGSGLVTYTQINGALPITSEPIYQVLNVFTVVTGLDYEAQFKNYDQIPSILRNTIMTPTNTRAIWSYVQSNEGGAVQLYPKQALSTKVRILKSLKPMDESDLSFVPELAEYTHEEVCYVALEAAGLTMREQLTFEGNALQAQKEANP